MANVGDDDDLTPDVRAYLVEAGIPTEVADRAVVLSGEQPGLHVFVDLLGSSWSLEGAADALGCTLDEVVARIVRGELYAHPLAHGLRVPTWQVMGGRPIPGLVRLLDGVLAGVHPAVLQEFMMTPDARWEDMTPVEWLITGGSVEPVVRWMRDRWSGD